MTHDPDYREFFRWLAATYPPGCDPSIPAKDRADLDRGADT
jgi:hypothetical protein